MITDIVAKGPPRVLKYEESGRVVIAQDLDGPSNEDFQQWFRNPSGHEHTATLDPTRCRVFEDRVEFDSKEDLAEKHVELVRGWIAKASKYAREKAARREDRFESERKTGEDLERKRRDLEQKLK